MDVPERWQDYPCLDHFSLFLPSPGPGPSRINSGLSNLPSGWRRRAKRSSCKSGVRGVDGIGFGYRKGHPGFWAYHRMIDREFQFLAPTIQQFLR